MSTLLSSDMDPEVHHSDDVIFLETGKFTSADTIAYATKARDELVASLRRGSALNPSAKILASRMMACEPFNRCDSGACPLCVRSRQRWMVLNAMTLMAAYSNCSIDELGAHWVTLQVVPTLLRRNGYRTAVDDFRIAFDTVIEAMNTTEVEFFIGGLRAAYCQDRMNEHASEIRQYIRVSMVVERREFVASEASLRDAFPGVDGVADQFIVRAFSGNPDCFEQMTDYRPALEIHETDNPPAIGRHYKVALPEAYRVRLACHLHRRPQTIIGMNGRPEDIGVTWPPRS